VEDSNFDLESFELKKIFILLILFVGFVYADKVEDFINQQITIETKLLDSNISQDTYQQLRKQQQKDYKKFFLSFATNKNEYLSSLNPYKQQISQLKIQIQSNKYKKNYTSIKRDKLKLKLYEIKLTIRSFLNNIYKNAKLRSKDYFKDKISDLINKYYQEHKSIDKSLYQETTLKPILTKVLASENMVNTFYSQVLENSTSLYHTIKLSSSKIFALVNNLNSLTISKELNKYLSLIQMDVAKVLLILFLVLLISLINLFTNFLIDKFLKHYKLDNDDIEYVHTYINKTINYLTSLIIIHIIIVVYFGFDIKSFDISKVFLITYVILGGILVYRIINLIASIKLEEMQKSKLLRNEVLNLAIKVSNSIIILLCIILILKIIGVDLTALLSGLGIGGFALAFAAKDSIANIFGSISILASDMFEQGDWIEVGDIDGTVVEIGLRGTTIRTFDNALISVPNFKLANEGVKNWSKRSIGRRIKLNIGVTYESNMDDIKNAISQIRDMLRDHPDIANKHTQFKNPFRQAKLVSKEDLKGVKRTTMVYLDSFGDSSINILIYCFSRSVDWGEWLRVKEDILYKIADILKQNNLEFAYPTMMIHRYDKEIQTLP
jgi:MscS family membrane protein